MNSASFKPVSYRPSSVSDPILLNLPRPQQQPTSLTIDYTYDALHRITGATYSDGRTFNYTYDAAGNVLQLEQNLGPGTVTTAYTYNIANELVTAQQDSTTWQYTYDANGSLTEVLPGGTPANGAKRYTYNSAGNLVQVEAHNGTGWDTQAEMDYNGLGQRLSMDAAGVIAHYVMDGDSPLSAESAGNTTFYLYGLGAIGEKTNVWNFSLPDGSNTPRQLTDVQGEITLSARYTPWGDSLEIHGTGNFSFGYLGGVLDATTGLLYVGNGQYYDPSTGRFLTRDARPNQTNPYVPWNPIGAIFAPLAVLSMFYIRKRKRNKWDTLLIFLVLGGALAMSLTACGPGGTATPPAPNPTPVPGETPAPVPPGENETPGGGNDTGNVVTTPEPGIEPPDDGCPTPQNWLPEPFLITHYTIAMEDDDIYKNCFNCRDSEFIPFWVNGNTEWHTHNLAFIYGILDSATSTSESAYWGVYQEGTGYTRDHKYISNDFTPSHLYPGFDVTFVYGQGGACGTYLEKDKTVAVSINNKIADGDLGCGDQYYIEGHGDTIFTITDDGTKPNDQQFDIFVGPMHKADFDRDYPDTHTFYRVAKVQP